MNHPDRNMRVLLAQYGFVIVRMKNHAVCRHDSGAQVVVPLTPSETKRVYKNAERDMKRALGRIQ